MELPWAPGGAGLWCDLYELTMAAAYLEHGVTGEAVFSLYVRDLPPDRGYLVAAGVDDAVDAIVDLGFTADDRAALHELGFAPDAVDRLAGLRFTGDVWAVPEGRIVTAGEPILEVTAPIAEAQLAETLALNQITYQTTIATKLARCRVAAQGRIEVVDFAFRRAHGVEAALAVARLSGLVGLAGTSNVPAALHHGLRAVGTMAHSYIEAFPSEVEAFRTYARSFPDRSTFLVDTYDTPAGVDHAIEVVKELGLRQGVAVRIDSGDLAALARDARARLDAAGLPEVRILVSGGLDEHALAALVAEGAPIDAVGVGTTVGVAADAPAIESVYKLVRYEGRPVRKRSPGKATVPGAKQVWRSPGADEDVVTERDEPPPVEGAQALLAPVVVGGRRVAPRPSLDEGRRWLEADLAALPPAALALRDPTPLAARFSPTLQALVAEADATHGPEPTGVAPAG
ncbi:MAG TPA: nicotinate phosphoribosyltransferase [Acidimicrobiales bacterium]